MPDAFAISSPTTSAKGRAGQVTFTVTNATGRPVRIRGSVTGTDPVKAEWFTPGPEQDCVIGGTVQFNVGWTVPKDVPPTSPGDKAVAYPLKFVAAAEDRPEEDFSELSWSLEVPAPDTKKSGGFPIWLPFVILGVVAVAVVIYLLVKPGPDGPPDVTTTTTASTVAQVAVPDVNRQDPTAAAKTINAAGLKAVVDPSPAQTQAANEFPCVVATFPVAGTLVRPGTQVQMLTALCRKVGPPRDIGMNEVTICSRYPGLCQNQRLDPVFREDLERDARLNN
jgi:hypothetical protein